MDVFRIFLIPKLITCVGKSDFNLRSVLPDLVVVEGSLENVISVAEQNGAENNTHTEQSPEYFHFLVFVKSGDTVLVCEPCP